MASDQEQVLVKIDGQTIFLNRTKRFNYGHRPALAGLKTQPITGNKKKKIPLAGDVLPICALSK